MAANTSDRDGCVITAGRVNPADFARFAEILAEATLLVDGNGLIVTANQAATLLLGRPRDALVGRALTELTTGDAATVAELIRVGSRSPQRHLAALRFRVPGGVEVRVRCELAAVRPRSAAMPALLSIRLFERHEVVDRFQLLNQRIEELSREIARRRAAEVKLQAYSDQLIEAGRRKDEFLAMLAHELRNPLAPMALGVGMLESWRSKESRIDGVATMMRRQLTHLTRLVDDLLDVARLTHGKIELQRRPQSVDDLLHQAVEVFRTDAEKKALQVRVETATAALRVDADAVRLVQVFGNLLSNAIKFSHPGGRIVVSTRAADAGVTVSVRDEGVGIGADLLPRVFDLFVQGDRSLDRRQGGLGVGLAVVRNIVELHGGSVAVRSAGAGQGTEMSVWLPRSHAVSAALPPATANAASCAGAAPRLRVLVVEDNPDTADAMREMLTEWGHDAACVADGPAALASWSRWRPDVGLLDIGLPGMSGLALARRLRTLADEQPLLLLALSGYGSPADAQASLDAGFDEHLVKPVDLDRLERRLARHAASLAPRPAA